MIKAKYREAMSKLGLDIEEYRVKGEPGPVTGDPLDRYCGVALKRGDRDVVVIEQEPRGWGGNGRWYVRERRTRDGEELTEEQRIGLGVYRLQREALGAIVRRGLYRR